MFLGPGLALLSTLAIVGCSVDVGKLRAPTPRDTGATADLPSIEHDGVASGVDANADQAEAQDANPLDDVVDSRIDAAIRDGSVRQDAPPLDTPFGDDAFDWPGNDGPAVGIDIGGMDGIGGADGGAPDDVAFQDAPAGSVCDDGGSGACDASGDDLAREDVAIDTEGDSAGDGPVVTDGKPDLIRDSPTAIDSVVHTVKEFGVLTTTGQPWGIAAGPDGNLWFTERSSNKIGRMTPTGTVTEYSLPVAGGYPAGIVAGPDGNLWFTENSGNKIGRDTTSGTIAEYTIPSSGAGPTGITAGPDAADARSAHHGSCP